MPVKITITNKHALAAYEYLKEIDADPHWVGRTTKLTCSTCRTTQEALSFMMLKFDVIKIDELQ